MYEALEKPSLEDLQHYGVKGMRWGVRRTPEQLGHVKEHSRPYRRTPQKLVDKGANLKISLAKDILGREISKSQAIPRNQDSGRTDLKKGSKVMHVSGIDFNQLRAGQLYVTATLKDQAMYQAFLGAKLKRAGYSPKAVSLKLKTDLHAPSSKDQYQIFKEFQKKNKKQIEDDIKTWLTDKGKDPVVASGGKELYDQFINSIEKTSSSQKKFYDELRKRGYNAVLDEHDITGSWMQGERPLIVMDVLNTFGSIKVKELTEARMRKNLDEYLK